MRLCTYPLPDGLCGEPSEDSRCTEHRPEDRHKLTREQRGYNDAWRKLSKRARELQPWCSHCGTTEDLTCDHLEWPARTLQQVDVLCRPCNARKGKPTPENDPRGKTQTPRTPHPLGMAFDFTQLGMVLNKGGVDHG